jgi:hypothetical protein
MLKLEKAERVMEDIRRWADEDGQIVGMGNAPRPSDSSSTLKPSEPHER